MGTQLISYSLIIADNHKKNLSAIKNMSHGLVIDHTVLFSVVTV